MLGLFIQNHQKLHLLAPVDNIQTTDCQRFKNIAKFAHLRPSGLSVANIASTEAENEQIV